MSVHAAHLSAEQAAGDERDRWPEGLPLEAPELPPWERLCDPLCRCPGCLRVLHGDITDDDFGRFTGGPEETR